MTIVLKQFHFVTTSTNLTWATWTADNNNPAGVMETNETAFVLDFERQCPGNWYVLYPNGNEHQELRIWLSLFPAQTCYQNFSMVILYIKFVREET